jgi:hypothetical protein
MIQKYKHPVLEPRESAKLNVAMHEYYNHIRNGADHSTSEKSAVFFAVCRGKVSEGLDFADANGRAVVVVGLPFPQAKDPRINLKKDYMDLMKRTRQQVPGAPPVRLRFKHVLSCTVSLQLIMIYSDRQLEVESGTSSLPGERLTKQSVV